MATVRSGFLAAREFNWARRTQWERIAVGSLGPVRLKVVAPSPGDASDAAALDSAGVVVGVGQGIGAPENLALVRELAGVLGGRIAATRQVTERGWLPGQYQVGLTGRVVSPLLYVAVALRGAPEHVAGMRRSGFVVAINNDPGAPIFEHADLCQVADHAEAVPALIDSIRRRLAMV
jgi:electron transfer flavoprotein alpha subunit